MKVYELVTYGLRPKEDFDEDAEDGERFGELSQGFFVSLGFAQMLGEKLFVDADDKPHSNWIKDARVWAINPHEDPKTDRLWLWSMLPRAAGRMSDPPGTFYPQARTTSIFIRTIDVSEEKVHGNAPDA